MYDSTHTDNKTLYRSSSHWHNGPELNPMMHNELCTWCQMSYTLIHVLLRSPSVHSYLQQFVEVFDVTFLDLLCRDLSLFEMDVLVVKCLKEEKNRSY